MKWTVLTALALATALAAGCGKKDSNSSGSSGSGDSGSSSSAPKTPEDAAKAFKAAGEAGDVKALWGAISKKSRNKMVEHMQKQVDETNKKGDAEWEEASKDLGKPAAELKKMSAEDLMILQISKEITSDKEKDEAKKLKIDKVEMRKNDAGAEIAVVFLTKHDGRKDLWALVKEDGTWKMDMEEGDKLDAEKEKLNEGK